MLDPAGCKAGDNEDLWESLNLMVSKVSIFADKQAQQISTPVTSVVCLKGPRRPPYSAVRSMTSAVAAAPPCCHQAAAVQQP